MSFLGSLFDPAGALATGGNNNSFDSVFNPGQNFFGNDGLGWSPDFMDKLDDNVTAPIGNFADNVVDSNMDELRNLGNHFGKNPGQVFYSGADPFSTKVWNAVTNQNNTPFLNQYGGETKQDFQNSANHGVNTEDNQYMATLAQMIASYYGGNYLGTAAAGAAGAGAGSSAGATGNSLGGGLASYDSAAAAGSTAPQVFNAAGTTAGTGSGAYGTYEGYNAVGNAARGGASGGANALDNGQNPFKGFAQGAVNGGLSSPMDYAGTMGVDNPYYKGAINGGINGGVRAGMQDSSQTGYGALVGALGGLANKAGSAIGNYFSQPTGGSDGVGGTTSGGTTNWGNLAAGLGNLYMSSRNNAGIQGQINNLNSLYQPGGAYANQMQQALDRQDAASGRRSQYGTRAVELQAALANAASRNAPTLANLYQQQRQNRFGQLAGMFAMGKNSGLFNGLGGMFGGQQQQPQYQVPMTGTGQLDNYDASPAVNATIPDQLYGG